MKEFLMKPASERLSQAAKLGADPERTKSTGITPRSGLVALHKGDPCFATPAHISEAAAEAVRQGYTHYPPPTGDLELRTILAGQLSQKAARSYTPGEVLVTVGATQALYAALTAYLNPGDEALILDPGYSLYAPLVSQTSAVPVFVPMAADFHLDEQSLRRAITPKTRLLIFNNPANPTGVVFSAAELEVIARIANENDLLVVADEVYDHLIFGEKPFTSVLENPDLVERTLYINSFSKTYAMTGWRVGYLAAPRALLEGPITLHLNAVNSVNWASQRAAIAALTGPRTEVEIMVEGYRERRRVLLDNLKEVPGLEVVQPEGAFYVFARFKGLIETALTSTEMTEKLMEGGVAVRSGSEYGPQGEGYIRLSYSATLEDIVEGTRRIQQVFLKIAKS